MTSQRLFSRLKYMKKGVPVSDVGKVTSDTIEFTKICK